MITENWSCCFSLACGDRMEPGFWQQMSLGPLLKSTAIVHTNMTTVNLVHVKVKVLFITGRQLLKGSAGRGSIERAGILARSAIDTRRVFHWLGKGIYGSCDKVRQNTCTFNHNYYTLCKATFAPDQYHWQAWPQWHSSNCGPKISLWVGEQGGEIKENNIELYTQDETRVNDSVIRPARN